MQNDDGEQRGGQGRAKRRGNVEIALALIEGKLHRAVGDKRCGCGACAYWIVRAARTVGISRSSLEAALPPAAKPEPHGRRGRRAPGASRARICEAGTFRVRGRDVDAQQGLGMLLARLHESG